MRGARRDARLAALSDEDLAREPGADAARERDQRARENACEHPRPRRIGKSNVLHCSGCGAHWMPPSAGGNPNALGLSTGRLMGTQASMSAQCRASRAIDEAAIAEHRARLFPASAIRDLLDLLTVFGTER